MTCGLTPQKLALTLCLGAALGVMPLLWGTTLICIIVAHFFRLNQLALQSVNYLLYPVQLALLPLFFKMGSWLFPWGPPQPPHMLATLVNNPCSSLTILGWLTLKSLAAWVVTVIPVALFAYGILMAAATRNNARISGL